MTISYSEHDVRSRVDRALLIADEARRWLRRYQIVYGALAADGLVSSATVDHGLPRLDQVGRLPAVKVADEARRYLDAVAPNVATHGDVRDYVGARSGAAQTASTINSALATLVRDGHARMPRRGRYVSTKASRKPPRVTGGRPEFNPSGLLDEVERLLLIHGPLKTKALIAMLSMHFTISGDPTDNFYTIVGGSSAIRYLKGIGYVLIDLIHLQSVSEAALHYRHGGKERFDKRGLAKAQENRKRKFAEPEPEA